MNDLKVGRETLSGIPGKIDKRQQTGAIVSSQKESETFPFHVHCTCCKRVVNCLSFSPVVFPDKCQACQLTLAVC